MARGPIRGFLAVLILAVAACAPSVGIETTTTGAPTTTTSAPAAATTSTPPTTSAPTATSTGMTAVSEIDAEVTVPDGEGPFPAVVLVHGGGWVAGAPGIMDPLADFLNENGYLTVNTRYTLATFDRPAFPDAVEDVACAVRHAASHPDGDGTVAVIGHSAGAHIGALVALTGDDYPGDCPYPGSGLPDRFVGLAGPYDVSRLGIAIAAFFGGGPERVPDLWKAGNPLNFAGANPDLQALIMYGDLDGIVADVFAVDFHETLIESGVDSVLEVVEGARHNEMHQPDLVGDLIVTWLGR